MTPLVDFERWSKACLAVGVATAESDYRRVRRAWRTMGRHYHTLRHLDARLREPDDARTRVAARRGGADAVVSRRGVSQNRYVAGRGKLLNSLLARASIYRHDLFQAKYEQQARTNIGGALRRLEWQ